MPFIGAGVTGRGTIAVPVLVWGSCAYATKLATIAISPTNPARFGGQREVPEYIAPALCTGHANARLINR